MSKIDKIIQILHSSGSTVYGLSESGRMYIYLARGRFDSDDPSLIHTTPIWELDIESPVVDNSAVENEMVWPKGFEPMRPK